MGASLSWDREHSTTLPIRRKESTNMVSKRDWREVLAEHLISRGTTGAKQVLIVQALQKYATAKMIAEQLAIWHEERKVDQYRVKTGGREATVWRATNLLPGAWD